MDALRMALAGAVTLGQRTLIRSTAKPQPRGVSAGRKPMSGLYTDVRQGAVLGSFQDAAYAEKAACAAQVMGTENAGIKPPMTDLISKVLDEAIAVVSETGDRSDNLLGRLFGSAMTDPQKGSGEARPPASSFEQVLSGKLQQLLETAHRARGNVARLDNRL